MKFTDLLYLALLELCADIIVKLGKRVARALRVANAGRPYNPPRKIYVNERNEWEIRSGSQRMAWWRTFLREI